MTSLFEKKDAFALISEPLNKLQGTTKHSPFNAGKVKVDLKSPTFSLKNTFVDDKISSKVALKSQDVLLGLGNGFKIPITKTYDGKELTVKVGKECNVTNVRAELDTSFTPSTGSFSNVAKGEFVGHFGSVGLSVNPRDFKAAKVHGVATYKGVKLGVQGHVNDLHNLHYIFSPHKSLFVETDLAKFNLGYLLSSEKHQVGLKVGFTKNTKEHSFAFAAKRKVGDADIHIKADLTGKLDAAHVSHVDFGEFKNVKCTLGGEFNLLKWHKPKFGAGLEFSF